MEKAHLTHAAFVNLSPFVLLICLFLVSIQSRASWARVRRDLDIIWRWQQMRGTAWDWTPQACCRGPARAGCQEWLSGPSGTSLWHLTSALQLSPALTLSRLEIHIRQEGTMGMWSITFCHITRISSMRIFYILEYMFSKTMWRKFSYSAKVVN